jgi:hypothetical protein
MTVPEATGIAQIQCKVDPCFDTKVFVQTSKASTARIFFSGT